MCILPLLHGMKCRRTEGWSTLIIQLLCHYFDTLFHAPYLPAQIPLAEEVEAVALEPSTNLHLPKAHQFQQQGQLHQKESRIIHI